MGGFQQPDERTRSSDAHSFLTAHVRASVFVMLYRDMTTLLSVGTLTDSQLLARVRAFAQRERQATADLIATLAELDVRRLYLGAGYSSLFTYCTHVLHLSEHATYGRIEAPSREAVCGGRRDDDPESRASMPCAQCVRGPAVFRTADGARGGGAVLPVNSVRTDPSGS